MGNRPASNTCIIMRTDLIFKNIPVELADKLVKLAMEFNKDLKEDAELTHEDEDSEMCYQEFLSELNSKLGDLTVASAIKLVGSIISMTDHETYDEDLEEIIRMMKDESLTFIATTKDVEVLSKVMTQYKLAPSLFYESVMNCLHNKGEYEELKIHNVIDYLDYDKLQR